MYKKNNSGFTEVVFSFICLTFLIFLVSEKSSDNENSEIITMIAFFVTVLFVVISLIKYCIEIIYSAHKEKMLMIDMDKKQLKKYDKVREHIEKEISSLQSDLVNSSSDWKMANHLPLSAQKKNYDEEPVQNAYFIKRFGLSEKDLSIDKKMVFLLTPFSNEATKTYVLIKNICSECGLNLYRGDEEFSHEDILTNIVKYIVKARIIVANIDGKNPNVFYELGIAHTLGKPTILVSKAIENAPFDIQQNRIVLYKNDDELKIKLSKELSRILVEY